MSGHCSCQAANVVSALQDRDQAALGMFLRDLQDDSCQVDEVIIGQPEATEWIAKT